ncbi:MAG: hypothetical protein QXI91_00175 [Candidatus Bathyarchaeia archaeon]
MRVLTNKKAISTLTLIILLLCATVFGALISYLLVMTNYYNMPENTTMLIVEDVVFPNFTVKYFNVTILNPSNSASDVNITTIRICIVGKSEVYDVAETEPELGSIKRGTRQTFKCLRNWGDFAGETVRIEPVAANVSTLSPLCTVPKVKLELTPTFDETTSVEYFNLTIKNSAESIMNLTILDIQINWESIKENVTPPLTEPLVLSPSQSEEFKCNWSWDWSRIGRQNFTITVITDEGYEAKYTTSELPGAYLYVDEIKFDYADPSYFNVTVSSSKDSTAMAWLNKVNLTLENESPITLNVTLPPINVMPIPLAGNDSLTIKCHWDWNSYRNKTITVNVYTKEGFTVFGMTVNTPPEIVWNITDVKFDLDYTDYFLVNVTNTPCSLRSITVNKILLDETEVAMEPASATLANGTQAVFNCSVSRNAYIGKTVNVTVITAEGLSISRVVEISTVGLKLLGDNLTFSDLQDPNINVTIPYINVTISNSVNSLQNVAITKIVIEGNGTYEIDGSLSNPKFAPESYILKIGETVTVICPCNYIIYLPAGGKVTITVYTAEGFQVSRTWNVP